MMNSSELKKEIIYTKHKEQQNTLICHRAEKFFINKGIQKTSFSAIASACGVTRSTLYKYYKDKDELLWSIYHKKMQILSEGMYQSFSNSRHTTYDRFHAYFHFLQEKYRTDPDWFKFFSIFYDSWQHETSRRSSEHYQKVFQKGDFGSKDTVRFLCKNFNDGSVREDLDAETTAVALTYAGLHIVLGLLRSPQALSIKYGIHSEEMIDSAFRFILNGLKQ
ncbi:TetR/AcrR family transcriptional regulator [Lacrimispora sp.]|uniref:TetR/AcrR family transcriptional regulator n=1 Tax=Lacrimispora sp. TaxID=2719234 RepID=UPI003990EB8A